MGGLLLLELILDMALSTASIGFLFLGLVAASFVTLCLPARGTIVYCLSWLFVLSVAGVTDVAKVSLVRAAVQCAFCSTCTLFVDVC